MTWAMSAMIGCKPVRCLGLMPGVSLYVSVDSSLPMEQLVLAARGTARRAIQEISKWMEAPTTAGLVLTWETSVAHIERDAADLPPANTIIERRYPWEATTS